MEYRELGKTGWKVSEIICGTWQFGDPTGTWKKQAEEVEDAIIKAALDAGINAFDTAEAYGAGASEQALARALSRAGVDRSKYYILSKINPDNLVSAEKVREAVERSLKNLNTPYIDLYQIHWANHNMEISAQLKELEKIKAEGKIRAIGVSNFGVKDLSEAVASGVQVESDQLPYSLVTRAIEFGITDVAVKSGVSILAYSPLCQGILSGKYESGDQVPDGITRTRFFHHTKSPKAKHSEEGCEKELFEALHSFKEVAKKVNHTPGEVALAWALAQPGVAAVIVGASKPEQIAENVKAVKVKLSPEVLKELTQITEPVKAKLGPNPDLWAPNSRYA